MNKAGLCLKQLMFTIIPLCDDWMASTSCSCSRSNPCYRPLWEPSIGPFIRAIFSPIFAALLTLSVLLFFFLEYVVVKIAMKIAEKIDMVISLRLSKYVTWLISHSHEISLHDQLAHITWEQHGGQRAKFRKF